MAGKKPGQPNGPANSNWKHGGYSDYMSKEDRDWIVERARVYLEHYPHLREPAMADLLSSYLKLLRQIERMWESTMVPDFPAAETGSALERIMRLTKSCSLLGSRMGITYTSQRRQVSQSEDVEVKLPEEIIAEFTEEKKD